MTSIRLMELDAAEQKRRPWVAVALTALLVWSLGLRVWYATPTLNASRFYDERYGLENLEPLLKEGSFRPVHGFHPGLSYLPHGLFLKASDLAHRATDFQALAIFDQRGRYTPTAYLICRVLQAVVGTLSIFLLFLIGRRLGGERLGLLAGFLLSVVPWHLRQSVLFKADIVLICTLLLTVYLSLRAVESPSITSFALTGVAIGLALSSKFNAPPVAVPITVGAFLSQLRWRRVLILLVVAGLLSVTAFLIIQPYFLTDIDIYQKSMGRTQRVYEREAQRLGHSHWYLYRHAGESLASSAFHGPLVAGLGFIGWAVLAILAMRNLRRSRTAVAWLMTISFVVAYPTMYALATPRPSPHNWLPLSAFVGLGAAWTLLAVFSLLEKRFSGTRAVRAIAVSLTIGLVLFLGWSASRFVYRNTVPETGHQALEALTHRLGNLPGRLVISEYDFRITFSSRHVQGALAVESVDDLTSLPRGALNRADAVVFRADRLEDPVSAAFYRSQVESLQAEGVLRVSSSPFRAWGPALVVLVHPHKRLQAITGEWVRSQRHPRLFFARIGGDGEADSLGHGASHVRGLMSLEFSLPRSMGVPEVQMGNRGQAPVEFWPTKHRRHFVTRRFNTNKRLALRVKRISGPDRVPFILGRWKRKGSMVSSMGRGGAESRRRTPAGAEKEGVS